jgi:hypothetical protein
MEMPSLVIVHDQAAAAGAILPPASEIRCSIRNMPCDYFGIMMMNQIRGGLLAEPQVRLYVKQCLRKEIIFFLLVDAFAA